MEGPLVECAFGIYSFFRKSATLNEGTTSEILSFKVVILSLSDSEKSFGKLVTGVKQTFTGSLRSYHLWNHFYPDFW